MAFHPTSITGRTKAVGGPARRGHMGVPHVRGLIAVAMVPHVPKAPRPAVVKALAHMGKRTR